MAEIQFSPNAVQRLQLLWGFVGTASESCQETLAPRDVAFQVFQKPYPQIIRLS